MKSLCTSSGLGNSCTEGAEASCCVHRVIPTKSIIRIELEQQTYADSNIIQEPATDCPAGFRAFRRCLKGLLLYLIASCCGIVPSRSFWMVLEMVQNLPERWRSETNINGRTAHSNRRTEKIKGSNASCGNVYHKRRE